MQLSINVRNMELTPRLQTYVEKKTSRLDRYMPALIEVRVDLSTQSTKSANHRQVAQVTIEDERGTMLRAEERSSDMFAAIDTVVEKLYRQIRRYRGKRLDRRKAGIDMSAEELEPLPIEGEDDEEQQTVVRRKRFTIRPTTMDEAVEQMELLGHDFFVFFNAEDEAVNVLYKRHGGNYGLLQPELE